VVEEGVRRWIMSGPILVQPFLPPTGEAGGVPPEEAVESLIKDLRAEGLDARISYQELRGGAEGGVPWDTILLWVEAEVGKAVINQVVQMAIRWMSRRFRQYPEDPPRRKFAQIVLYEGDEGEVVEIVELRSADAEPIRRSPEDFERYTRKKPLEGVRRLRRDS
jgi:hypothetical protein